MPYDEDLEACIRLGDISVTTTHLHACIGLEVRMKIVPISLCEIGIPGCEIACLNIGPSGLSNGTEHLALTSVFVEFFFKSSCD